MTRENLLLPMTANRKGKPDDENHKTLNQGRRTWITGLSIYLNIKINKQMNGAVIVWAVRDVCACVYSSFYCMPIYVFWTGFWSMARIQKGDLRRDASRKVRLGHRFDFGSCNFSPYKIDSCIHIDLHIILNSFWSRVKLSTVTSSGKYRSSGLF